jgi:hypothetical protein
MPDGTDVETAELGVPTMSTVQEPEVHGRSCRTYYDRTVRIPGFDNPPDRCRGYDPVGFCEHGHVLLGRSSCGTRYCPDHWGDWAAEATESVVARCAAYREAAEGAGKRLSHVVVSPPQDRRYSEASLYGTRSEAYEAAEAAGVRGGVCVTHPYRTTEEADWLYEEATERGDVPEDYGKWRFLREHVDEWDGLAGLVEAAPHYHILAAAEDIDPSEAPEGWVVERVRSFARFHRWDTEAYRDMARTAYYTLTHGAVTQGRATVTYFGELHPSQFDPVAELTAAAHDRITREAETVGGPEREAALEEACPRDGCEAETFELLYLREFLEDQEAVEAVRAKPDGYGRWLRLRGLLAYSEGRTDNPPPVVAGSEARLLEWLEERGRTLTPKPVQASLVTAARGYE